MLESFASLLLGILGVERDPLAPVQMLSWHEAALFRLPPEPDPVAEAAVQQYLADLRTHGIAASNQGIWIESAWSRMATHQGTVPLSAASLTKVATTLAALETWGADHQFETRIATTASVRDGVLQGDLIVVGGGDPLFVWEDAIALGNALNQLGIRRVAGDLVIVGDFAMNFQSDPSVAARLLMQALDARRWPAEAIAQFQLLPAGTPRPQVAIAGSVRAGQFPPTPRWLLRQRSLRLWEILKHMNVYSNNSVAQMLATQIGGAAVVSRIAIEVAGVAPDEIQLINGSGLGVDNRLSPRAACQLLKAIHRHLHAQPLTLASLFPVAASDREGTIRDRALPPSVAVKTGTLWNVSALAGAIPVRDDLIYFAVINQGTPLETFRRQQDQLVQRLAQQREVTPLGNAHAFTSYFGDPQRILPGG